MHYRELEPHPGLRPHVACLWILRDDPQLDPREPRAPERVLPDGNLELIVHFGDPFAKLDPRGGFAPQARALFAGQLESWTMLRPGSRVGAIGARFRPGGVAPFFHFPLDAATGEVLPLDGLLGRDAAILEEGVLAARSDAERVAAVESFLLARRGADADPLVATVVERIRAARGTAPPAALFSGLAPSPRQIERRFLHHVGVSPRQLSRIARFQRALRRLAGGRAVSLTTVAHDCGYYDQSHFIRDFKAFAGLSPRAYRAERHPLADLFSDGD